MRITIEVDVPDSVDLDHAWQSVTDALYFPEEVTEQEYLLVSRMLDQLASKKSNLSKGFRYWAETHHEIVCTIHAMIDNETMPDKLIDIVNKDGFSGLYGLGVDLTNEFCNTYENRTWEGDWIDTIIEFLNLKLQ